MQKQFKTSTPQDRHKRMQEITTYLADFRGQVLKVEEKTIIFRDDSVEIIHALYYRYAEELVRNAIESRKIQHFKIASTTEMVILLASPIVMDDPKLTKYYNARLALYTALRFLIEWNKRDLDLECCFRVIGEDEETGTFLDEHFKWLYLLDPNYYNPLFFDAQIWRLFLYLLKAKSVLLK